MKRINTITLLFLAISMMAQAQKLTKKEARRILQTAYDCLKENDSLRFVKLWHIDDMAPPYHSSPFTEKNVMLYFHYYHEFIDTAIQKNISIESMNMSKVDDEMQKMNFGKYKVSAWFRYGENYYKGFGFFLDFINNEWKVRYLPESSTLTRV
jgi:hypothetical protein